MNKKKNNHILPNQNAVVLISVGGIRAIINTNGIIDTDKMIPDTIRKKIENTLSPCLENILEGWKVEGEFKNDVFYVNYIIDDSGKVLDIYDTKDWAGIMGFSMIMPEKKDKFKNINKNFNIRPESSFMASDYENMTTGKGGWRKRIKEVICNELQKR